VWRSPSGTDWTPVVSGGLGDPNNRLGYGLIEYEDQLCLFTGNAVSGGEVWRSADGTGWEQVGFGG
jgi:hypothetical protein